VYQIWTKYRINKMVKMSLKSTMPQKSSRKKCPPQKNKLHAKKICQHSSDPASQSKRWHICANSRTIKMTDWQYLALVGLPDRVNLLVKASTDLIAFSIGCLCQLSRLVGLNAQLREFTVLPHAFHTTCHGLQQNTATASIPTQFININK